MDKRRLADDAIRSTAHPKKFIQCVHHQTSAAPKTRMFRSHQRDMLDVARQIKAGKPWRQVIAQVTTGGGKSALPVILAAELLPAIARKICWVVPRVALQQQ